MLIVLCDWRVMSRIERSHENCEIYDNSQDHWRSLCNLFKRLQGGPVQSYENCENYREGPSKVTKVTKFSKTAKFTIIRKTIDEVYVIHSKGCREALSKFTRIAKITTFTKTAKFTNPGHKCITAIQLAVSCSEWYFVRCCALKRTGKYASESKVMCLF